MLKIISPCSTIISAFLLPEPPGRPFLERHTAKNLPFLNAPQGSLLQADASTWADHCIFLCGLRQWTHKLTRWRGSHDYWPAIPNRKKDVPTIVLYWTVWTLLPKMVIISITAGECTHQYVEVSTSNTPGLFSPRGVRKIRWSIYAVFLPHCPYHYRWFPDCGLSSCNSIAHCWMRFL